MLKAKLVLNVNLEAYAKRKSKQVAAGMAEASKLLVRSMKARVSILYPPPSEPGQSPHQRTGDLLHSIYAYPIENNRKIKVGCFGIAYASMLEFGTSKMAARPFMWPAFKANKDKIIEKVGVFVRGRRTR